MAYGFLLDNNNNNNNNNNNDSLSTVTINFEKWIIESGINFRNNLIDLFRGTVFQVPVSQFEYNDENSRFNNNMFKVNELLFLNVRTR